VWCLIFHGRSKVSEDPVPSAISALEFFDPDRHVPICRLLAHPDPRLLGERLNVESIVTMTARSRPPSRTITVSVYLAIPHRMPLKARKGKSVRPCTL
jgi:hypothetical protein